MDKKTYEYMSERVEKYKKIRQQIAQNKMAVAACDNLGNSTPQLYISGNYYVLPFSILEVIKTQIEEIIAKQEAERESI